MIELEEQILSFVFSYIYGLVIAITFFKLYKYIYWKRKIISFFNSLLYCLINTFIYFKILYFIDGGYVNYYYILITIISFTINYKNFTKKYVNKR